MRLKVLLCMAVLFVGSFSLYADEVYLKNGDRITGTIKSQNQSRLIINTEAVGELTIENQFVEKTLTDQEIEAKQAKLEADKIWERKFSAGYSQTSGNTQTSQFSSSLLINRKTDDNEFTIKGNVLYGSNDKNMDTQKWYGSARYAQNFGSNKWFRFVKLESDHDRFANINYRLIPGAGIGYWFFNQEDFKLLSEAALGLEHTSFRDSTKDNNTMVLVPRVYFEKKLFGDLRISEDFTIYSSLESLFEYRVHSEAVLTNPISDRIDLKLSLINDYNSEPAAGIKKSDLQIISALSYSF